MKKVARYLRRVPASESAWWVKQVVVKFTPPLEYTSSVTYRKGKLLQGQQGLKRMRFDRRLGRELEFGELFKLGPDPMYAHSYKTRTTAFAVVSASDLKSMMEESRLKMVEHMKKKGDPAGVALFEKQSPFEVETYLFACHKDGKWKGSHELPGSQRGTLNHKFVLRDMGYELVGFPDDLEAKLEDWK